MATPIRIPDIGTTVNYVRLVSWLKQEGDTVKRGDPLCEVETDKAVSELESTAEGVLLKQLFAEDSEIEQGTVIAYVGRAGEPVPEERSRDGESGAAADQLKTAPAERGGSTSPAIPLVVRNLAGKVGVDLNTITGTGPGGRITREDVLKAKEQSSPAGTLLSRNQRAIGARVSRSQREIPAIHLRARIDMSGVIAERQQYKDAGMEISFDAFFVRAVARTMIDFPRFRSRLAGEKVVQSDEVAVGLALSEGDELFTPVIHGPDNMATEDVEGVIQDLVLKSKSNSYSEDDLEGATLTVSNLGMYPVQDFSAIIPPQQVAILSVGTIEPTPVVTGGVVAVVPVTTVTLSVDHRLINGREAAEFLTALKRTMENP